MFPFCLQRREYRRDNNDAVNAQQREYRQDNNDDVAGLELPQSVFTHGQLYVGWSRCGDPDTFYIFANQDEFENVRHLLPPGETRVFTRNVVYKEIFSHTRFNAS